MISFNSSRGHIFLIVEGDLDEGEIAWLKEKDDCVEREAAKIIEAGKPWKAALRKERKAQKEVQLDEVYS